MVNVTDAREIVTYSNPPLEEVAIAVQFAELPTFDFTKLNRVYQGFKTRTASIEEHPPIASQFELFDDKLNVGRNFKFTFTNEGLPPKRRVWFVGNNGTDVVQVQPDRFVRNWRKRAELPEYPRFETILPVFLQDFAIFSKGLKEAGYTEPTVNQVEVSYFNNIAIRPDQGFVSTMDRYFRFFSEPVLDKQDTSDGFESELSTVSMKFTFWENGPDSSKGRLHVDVQPGQDADGNQVLRQQIIARGRPAGSDAKSIERYICACRREIVTIFDACASDAARAEWGRQNVESKKR